MGQSRGRQITGLRRSSTCLFRDQHSSVSALAVGALIRAHVHLGGDEIAQLLLIPQLRLQTA